MNSHSFHFIRIVSLHLLNEIPSIVKMRMLSQISTCTILITLCIIITTVNSYKILGITFSPLPSHYTFTHALMKGLADDGNEVTFLSPMEAKNPIKNLRDIYIDLAEYRTGMCHLMVSTVKV